jgi:Fe-S-cluster containining protein
MSLIRKVRSVLKLFQELDDEIAKFSEESGLKCKPGCGECCLYPKVHATVLEFIPFAYKMVLQEKAFELLETLKSKETDSSYCIIYSPFSLKLNQGHCSDYENRGLICRLYGFSANSQKDGSHSMITCSIIKSNHPGFFKNAVSLLANSEHLPIAADYYSKVQSVDLTLSLQTYPINIAIRKALEYVLSYYAYRNFPKQAANE